MTARSPFCVLNEIAAGVIEQPASDEHSDLDRWSWFADLYAGPWGLVVAIPGFHRIVAEQIAAACRATATGTATVEQWQAIAALASAGEAASQSHGLSLAWSAVSDTSTDAIDHLTGAGFGGLEAVLGAIGAVLHQHSEPQAAAFLDSALAAWAHQLASPDRRAA